MDFEGTFKGFLSRFCCRKRSRSSRKSENFIKLNRSSRFYMHSHYHSLSTYASSARFSTSSLPTSAKSLLGSIADPRNIESLSSAMKNLSQIKAKGDAYLESIMRSKYKTQENHRKICEKQSKFQRFLDEKEVFEVSRDEFKQLWEDLSIHEDTEFFAQVKEFTLTYKDAKKLSPGKWLNDELINAYIRLCPCNSSTHILTTYMFQTLETMEKTKWDKAKLVRMLKRSGLDNMLAKPFLVFPVNIKQRHWAVVVLNHREQVIEYYDSLSISSMEYVCGIFEKFLTVLGIEAYDWEVVATPMQGNGSDCGMFVVKVMQALAKNSKFMFSSEDMRYYRKIMLAELKFGKIIVD